MGSKQIQIAFTGEQIETFNTMATNSVSLGVGETPVFNVIAQTYNITPNVTIKWYDEFRIAATKTPFIPGVKFDIATDPDNINFDQLPGKSFKMVNDTYDAAGAPVFMPINGQELPIYISDPIIPSREIQLLTPQTIVALWLQANGEAGTMVLTNEGDLSTFDFSIRSSVNLKYDGGKFVVA